MIWEYKAPNLDIQLNWGRCLTAPSQILYIYTDILLPIKQPVQIQNQEDRFVCRRIDDARHIAI